MQISIKDHQGASSVHIITPLNPALQAVNASEAAVGSGARLQGALAAATALASTSAACPISA